MCAYRPHPNNMIVKTKNDHINHLMMGVNEQAYRNLRAWPKAYLDKHSRHQYFCTSKTYSVSHSMYQLGQYLFRTANNNTAMRVAAPKSWGGLIRTAITALFERIKACFQLRNGNKGWKSCQIGVSVSTLALVTAWLYFPLIVVDSQLDKWLKRRDS